MSWCLVWRHAASSLLNLSAVRLSNFRELQYLYVILKISYSVIINDECSKGNLGHEAEVIGSAVDDAAIAMIERLQQLQNQTIARTIGNPTSS